MKSKELMKHFEDIVQRRDELIKLAPDDKSVRPELKRLLKEEKR